MNADEVAKDVVDSAIKLHRALGPGLLESAYQACLVLSCISQSKYISTCSGRH
jgi:PD-(D/E)XK nuclease superfamily